MKTYCTYCSAEKDEVETPLPAIARYKSGRISTVSNLAKARGLKFVILSGKYGILEADQMIDYYDHLLLGGEVDEHSDLIAGQLKEKRVSKIVFYTNSIERDQNLKPYIDCISIASAKCGIALEILEIPFDD